MINDDGTQHKEKQFIWTEGPDAEGDACDD